MCKDTLERENTLGLGCLDRSDWTKDMCNFEGQAGSKPLYW